MKKIRCIIVDDEALARKLLKSYMEQIPHLELVKSCKNPIEAMAVLQNENIDLMFLDIQMPQLTGVSFLKSLTQKPLVIFTTAYEQYALEGYALDVVDYLLKPFPFERFFQGVNKATERLKGTNNTPETLTKNDKDHLLVKSEHRIYRLKFKDILYIQSMQAYVAYYTKEERILSLNTMKKLEVILPNTQFLRIHKSYIVAIDNIEMLEGNQLILGKTKLPIGASYKEEVFKRIFED